MEYQRCYACIVYMSLLTICSSVSYTHKYEKLPNIVFHSLILQKKFGLVYLRFDQLR